MNLRLRQEVKSLSGLVLIDSTGKQVGTLKLAGDDVTNQRWKGEYATGSTVLRRDIPTQLGIRAILKTDRSISSELFDTAEFSLQVQGMQTGISKQIIPTATHYPYHQTALAHIQSIANILPATGKLQSGLRQKVASFGFSGTFVNGTSLSLEEVDLRIAAAGVKVSNWKIGGDAEIQQAGCGIDSSDPMLLSCSSIPETVRSVNGMRVLSVFADVTVLSGSTLPTFQVSLPTPGSVGANGSVHWTDGTGHFNWIEGPTPLVNGTLWTAN